MTQYVLKQGVIYYLAMVRLVVVFLILIPFLAVAQESADTIPKSAYSYEYLENHPWNGTVITTMMNPAFSGFDRRLQFGYSYEGENLRVPEGYDTKKSAFWNQTAIVDFAFGGKRNNVGLNVTYNGGQRLYTDYHRVQIAHSYRIHLKEHKLILGLGLRFLKLKGGSMSSVYADMIDPRYGFVYETIEFYGPDSVQFAEYSAGLIYNWKNLLFSYAFRYEHRSLLTIADNDFFPVQHLHAMYSLDFNATGQFAAGFTTEYNGFNWYMEPSILLMWKSMVFMKLSTPDVNQFKTEIGINLYGVRAVYSFSTYFDRSANQRNGIASMSGGLRYNFQPFRTAKTK